MTNDQHLPPPDLAARLTAILTSQADLTLIQAAVDGPMLGHRPYLNTSGEVAYVAMQMNAVGVGGSAPMASTVDSLPADGFAWIHLANIHAAPAGATFDAGGTKKRN